RRRGARRSGARRRARPSSRGGVVRALGALPRRRRPPRGARRRRACARRGAPGRRRVSRRADARRMTMPLDLSCAFATSLDTPAHVAVAERLGYRRAWLYDSPALYPDVWTQLCRAADRTDRIALGPGVLVPSLRHPLANASAIATLVDAAGAGRVAVAVGAGFTGRMAMGRRAMAWKDVAEYVRILPALLR